jgi:hypothetical protein
VASTRTRLPDFGKRLLPAFFGTCRLLIEHKGRLFNGAPRVEPLSDPPDLELPAAEGHSDVNLPSIRARLADPFHSHPIELSLRGKRLDFPQEFAG